MDFFEFDLATRLLLGAIAGMAFIGWNATRRHQKALQAQYDWVEKLEARIKELETATGFQPPGEERHILDEMFDRMDEVETIAEAEDKLLRGEKPIYELNEQVAQANIDRRNSESK